MTDAIDEEIPGVIAPADEDDVSAIAELFEQDIRQLDLDVDADRLVDLARHIVRDADCDPPDALCWVARPDEGGQPVGVVVANVNWSLKFAGRSLWIEELFVAPDARRRGFGRALVDRVVAYAQSHDVRGIDLEAYRGNTPASVLYRTAGFHRLGRERFYYRVDDQEYLS